MRTKKSLISSIISIVTSLGQMAFNGIMWFVLSLAIGLGEGFSNGEATTPLELDILTILLLVSVGFFFVKFIVSIISTVFSATARFTPKKVKTMLIIFAVFMLVELLFNAAFIVLTLFQSLTIVYIALAVVDIVLLVLVIINIIQIYRKPIEPIKFPVAEIVIEE